VRVAIAGGHGKIALALTPRLIARGDEVVSLIRNPDHSADVRAAGGEPATCDLESASEDQVAEAIAGCEAVVFAAGAGAGSGPERHETMDYAGAAKLIAAARTADAPRYVMVSAMAADAEHPGDGTFDVYLRAKGRADAELAASGLDFTIVRPGLLTDEPGTGRVKIAERTGRGEVPREDVAEVLAAVLEAPTTVGQTFELVSGEMTVAEAIDALAV
jgi:nucleoside-diphosphate-sugar epimerase